MKSSGFFWGTLIILVGVVLLAGTILSINIWPFLWPTLLIFIGIWFVARSRMRPKTVASEEVTIPLQGASRADIRIRHGAGRLVLREGAGSNIVASGSFTGGLQHTENRRGETLDVEMRVPEDIWMNFSGPWIFGPWAPIVWDVRLNDGIPMTLDLETGAGESKVDLHAIKAEEIRLKTGASSTEMTLPAQAGKTRVKISSGAASVVLRIPDGVAARIAVESGLAGINVDQNRFPRSGSGYQSAEYDRAANTVDIKIETGVGAVEIR